jgi:hypothetical protein
MFYITKIVNYHIVKPIFVCYQYSYSPIVCPLLKYVRNVIKNNDEWLIRIWENYFHTRLKNVFYVFIKLVTLKWHGTHNKLYDTK